MIPPGTSAVIVSVKGLTSIISLHCEHGSFPKLRSFVGVRERGIIVYLPYAGKAIAKNSAARNPPSLRFSPIQKMDPSLVGGHLSTLALIR